MSETQALVPVDEAQQALVAANPGLTLLEGYQILTAGSQPSAYQMDDDEKEALDGVKIRPLRLKMDGTTGKFSTTDDKESKGWEALDKAVILDLLDDSQVLFCKQDQAKKQIWPEGSTEWPNYLCRADSVHGVPVLHKDLTEPQRKILRDLKVVGALNEAGESRNCTTCPHAQFSSMKDSNGATVTVKPNCAKALNLLVFESHTKEPAILQAKGTSIKLADRHIATFKRQGRALYADLVAITAKQVVEDGTKWQVMTFTTGAPVGLVAAEQFRQVRKLMRPLILEEMRSGRNVILGADEEFAPDHMPPPAEAVGDALPPMDAAEDFEPPF